VLFAILSIVCMYYDQKDGWIQSIRYYLQAAAYPIQVAVSSPQALWNWTSEMTETRASLREENAQLKERERELSVLAMRVEALDRENARLRAMKQSLPPLVTRHQVAEAISIELTPLRQRLLINRGERDGAYRSQPVVDARGLLGQLLRVGPWSSEIILVTDPEHAVPVEIVRNGLRSIAVGAGTTGELLLPFLPVNSDVKPGDVLVTSGLGGVFPAGYPVAVVTGIKRDPVLLLAQVRARPLATIERDREVMLLWFDASHPAAPVARDAAASLPAVPIGTPAFAPPPSKGGNAPAAATPPPESADDTDADAPAPAAQAAPRSPAATPPVSRPATESAPATRPAAPPSAPAAAPGAAQGAR
jgi:rod shape-determining protein MreC